MSVLGVDIGGSGIKAALVDTVAGDFSSERERIPTPDPATPEAVIDTVARLADRFGAEGPVGVGVPAVVRLGCTQTASNIHEDWIDYPAEAALARALARPVALLNDADAAGVAEMRYGAGKGRMGTVLLLTLGTGIGSALFRDGVLVPNLELGHLYLRKSKHVAEKRAAANVRKEEDLDWEEWSGRLEEYLRHVEALVRPDLIVIGGGVSRKHDRFLPLIDLDTEIVPARLHNRAGIVGAAWAAVRRESEAQG